MPVPRTTLWPLEPHTKAKHEILRRYLGAWFPILNSFYGRIIYVDGFCGPGRYEGGEDGSPVIALQVAATHRRMLEGQVVFWFIDERADRIRHLKREVAQLNLPAHFQVHIETGRFADIFGAVLDGLDAERAPIAPTFAFIDPFGFSGIPFSLVRRLLGQARCEALITFQADAMNRFLDHPSGQVRGHIVEAFGTEEAISIADTPGDRVAALRELYQRQLLTAAKFVRFFEMRDRNDRVQYLLFFASNHRLGHLKMKEAMWRTDPTGEFRFSDATDPRQLVLFEQDHSGRLLRELAIIFRGRRRVAGEEVRLFVEDETAFLKKHMTPALQLAEANGWLVVEEKKLGGQKRRSGTYPDDCKVRFVSLAGHEA
jgi:three-Cys-motif partner protein